MPPLACPKPACSLLPRPLFSLLVGGLSWHALAAAHVVTQYRFLAGIIVSLILASHPKLGSYHPVMGELRANDHVVANIYVRMYLKRTLNIQVTIKSTRLKIRKDQHQLIRKLLAKNGHEGLPNLLGHPNRSKY